MKLGLEKLDKLCYNDFCICFFEKENCDAMFKNKGKFVVFGALLAAGLGLAACSSAEEISFEPLDSAVLEAFLGPMPDSFDERLDYDHVEGALAHQLAQPEIGEVFAVIHTNHGSIHVRLFPQYAPLAVRNFTTHANNGFFDDLTFHRVMPDFMIQGGCPLGTGFGGESIWGHSFGDELTANLRNIRGALSMANSGQNTNSSQFFIVQNQNQKPVSEAQLDYFRSVEDVLLTDYFGEHIDIEAHGHYMRDRFPMEFMEHYNTHGGTPHLDFVHTVFGQVFYGMDIVDAIAAVPLQPAPMRETPQTPVDTVYIITVELRVWE